MNSSEKSTRWKDAKTGKPLPLPAGEWVPGTDRPDVVIAKDPNKPLTVDNVREIYEIKFDGDEDKRRQIPRYDTLVPGVSATLLTAEKCGCIRGPKPRDWLLLYQRIYKDIFDQLEDDLRRDAPEDPRPPPTPDEDEQDQPDDPHDPFNWEKLKWLPIPVLPVLEELPLVVPDTPLFPLFWIPPPLPTPQTA